MKSCEESKIRLLVVHADVAQPIAVLRRASERDVGRAAGAECHRSGASKRAPPLSSPSLLSWVTRCFRLRWGGARCDRSRTIAPTTRTIERVCRWDRSGRRPASRPSPRRGRASGEPGRDGGVGGETAGRSSRRRAGSQCGPAPRRPGRPLIDGPLPVGDRPGGCETARGGFGREPGLQGQARDRPPCWGAERTSYRSCSRGALLHVRPQPAPRARLTPLSDAPSISRTFAPPPRSPFDLIFCLPVANPPVYNRPLSPTALKLSCVSGETGDRLTARACAGDAQHGKEDGVEVHACRPAWRTRIPVLLERADPADLE